MAARPIDPSLNRECPRCGAHAGIKCRDPRRPKKTTTTHIARGWLDRPCPSCHAQPDEDCRTPAGKPTKPHKSRWIQPRVPGQRYGYAHRSPDDPYAELQRDALTAAGCIRIWTDHQHAIGDGRTERTQLLVYLRPTDILVVWCLDALADTTAELAEIACVLQARKINLRSQSEQLDSAVPGAQLFSAIAAVATLQPSSAQPTAGRRAATTARRHGGRPPRLSADAHAAVRAMRDAGRTIDEIAATHAVSRPTIYRSLKQTAPA